NVPRNIVDEQIKAIAAKKGVIGVVGFPAFVSAAAHPSLDDYVAHIDYMVQLAGIDHVALGIDYFLGQHPITPIEQAKASYDAAIAHGRWSTQSYPPPP